jgi:hypothetical protein
MTTTQRRRMIAGTLVLAAAPAAVLLTAGPSAAVAGRPARPVVPAASTRSASLTAVSVAPRSTTAYALGIHGNNSGSSAYALRRSGGHWKTVKVQKETEEQLRAVAAGSSTSAWIAGYYYQGGTTMRPLIEHSKGSGFTRVPNKLPDGQITALAASSKNNAWATGSTTAGAPIAAHWNGHSWKSVSISAKTFGALGAVSTTSAKNVWAITNVNSQAASAHWNGKRWSLATIAPTDDQIVAIASSSAKNAWAVGYTYGAKGAQALTFHWNGKRWLKVASPSPGASTLLQGVTVHSHSGYVVGVMSGKTGLTSKPLVLKLSGKKWKVQHVAKRGGTSSLYAVSMSSKSATAVGAWYVHNPCGDPAHPFVVAPHGSHWGEVSAPEAVPAVPTC